MAAWRELNLAFLDDRNPVLGVVVAVAGAGVRFLSRPRRPDAAEPIAGLRVVELAFRSLDIPRAPPAAAGVQRETAGPGPQLDGGRCFSGGRSEIERHVSVDAFHTTRRNVFGDHVDEPADSIGAVQQRRGPADDIDARRSCWVDRDAVVTRLTRQVAHALPILKDLHAVAVEAANHRARRRRAEAARGDAGLALQGRA